MSTILLVDDDPDISETHFPATHRRGHSVKGAESGEKALAVLAALRPELVITTQDGRNGRFDLVRRNPQAGADSSRHHPDCARHDPRGVAATRRGVFGFQSKPSTESTCSTRWKQALRLSGVGPGEARRTGGATS